MPNKPLHQIPVTVLKGVGDKMTEKLAKIRIHTLQDLLFHLPRRYQDRTQISPVGSLNDGDEAVIEVVVDFAQIKQGRRRSLLIQVADDSGTMLLRFFYFSAKVQAHFKQGARIRCFGEARLGPQALEMIHPEYTALDHESIEIDHALTPIYPTTEGLHQKSFRDLTDKALAWLDDNNALTEWLPAELLKKHQHFLSLQDAVKILHRPPPDIDIFQIQNGLHPAQQRLVFEELLAHQLSLKLLRHRQQQHTAPALKGDQKLWQQLEKTLPFVPTNAQQRVAKEIIADLVQPVPMMRLIQGDVGAGKTLVAVIAALQAIEANYQVAIMAPTELLAEQHFINFTQWLKPLGITTVTLTGKHKGKARKACLEKIINHQVGCIVGTHALFQKDVEYHQLGLIIIDEQHRFGVEQRMALRKKGQQQTLMPHQLLMTATPIPRTLAMSAYADLAVSVIDELPPGRTPVKTVVIPDTRREEVIQRLYLACQQKRQAYWICTLIEESDMLQCQAVEDTAILLKEQLTNIKIGLVHGRIKAAEKNELMQQFKAGEIDLLIATTVIEVGVDVPNASLMIIENPERLGLAQLHQLRGRVGRGKTESHCVLMYKPPLTYHGRKRLDILRKSSDGFVIAQKDLELRGPGEVLGTKQTGTVDFKIADLLRDDELLPDIQKTADWMLLKYPKKIKPLIQRWLVDKEKYADA